MADAAQIDVEAILRVGDQSASSRVYTQVLNTIGHNHSGTLYVEAEEAVEPLVRIAVGGAGWPANTALEVLIDMLGCFGVLAIATPDHPVPSAGMRSRMRATATSHLPELRRVAGGADNYGTSVRAAQLIEELSAEND